MPGRKLVLEKVLPSNGIRKESFWSVRDRKDCSTGLNRTSLGKDFKQAFELNLMKGQKQPFSLIPELNYRTEGLDINIYFHSLDISIGKL